MQQNRIMSDRNLPTSYSALNQHFYIIPKQLVQVVNYQLYMLESPLSSLPGLFNSCLPLVKPLLNAQLFFCFNRTQA